jgi:MSHA biogenesis protein MshQ
MHPPLVRFFQPMNQSLQVESRPGRLLTTMRALLLSLCALIGLLMAPTSHAATVYHIPSALTSAPFNCTLVNGTYECGSINLDKDIDLNLTANVTMWVKGGSFTSQKNLTTINNGKTFNLSVDNAVSMQKDTDIDMNITASGSVTFAKNARIDGNITSSSNVTFAKDTTVNGNLIVSGDLKGAKNVIINGSCLVAGSKTSITCTGGTAALHHVRVTYDGSANTCSGKSVTVTACAGADNSSGSCTTYTGGITVTLDADSFDDVTLASKTFTIAPGSHSVTDTLPAITSAQTAYLSFNAPSKVTATQGTCWDSRTNSNSCAMEVTSCGVHHLRLDHGGTGVTCVPADVTINACSAADSSGTCTANTNGISGNLLAKNGGTVVAIVPFSIPAGQSSITKKVSITTAQSVAFSTADWSTTPQSTDTCWNGTASNCNYAFADSGFVFDVPDHLAGNTQTVTIKAVKKDATNSTAACQATLPDSDVDVDFTCNYSDPSTGTLAASIGKALSPLSQTFQCDGTVGKLNLHFTSGASTIYVNYPDVGKVKLNASYTGANTGTILGNDFFTAAPTRFAIAVASNTTLPLKADVTFDADVSAVNAAGVVTPNFAGSHIASLTFSPCGGATAGTFSGNLNSNGLIYVQPFTAGVGRVTSLKYSEVGRMDATAVLVGSDYTTAKTFMDLGTGFGVTGTTDTVAGTGCSGSFGTFRPFKLATTLEPTTTKYVYSGVPFKIRITAKNASNNVTKNYTSDYATDIALSAIPILNSVGALTVGNAVPATAIVPAASFGTTAAGYAIATPTYTFPAVMGGVNGAKLAPQSFYLRAVENSGTSPATTAGGGVPPPNEVKVLARYGRLRLFNVYGSSLTSLQMPVQAEYWTGSVWVVNGDDSTTKIPAASIGFPSGGDFTASAGSASDITLVAGKGTIPIANASKSKGFSNVTIHLGNNANTVATEKVNNSCLTAVANLTGADLLGLRSYQGCGAGGYTYDPAARANFGTQSQETKGVVHVREVFN